MSDRTREFQYSAQEKQALTHDSMLATMKLEMSCNVPISKDRLAIFTNYPRVNIDQTLEGTFLTLIHPVVHNCFQPVSVTIEDAIAGHYIFKG